MSDLLPDICDRPLDQASAIRIRAPLETDAMTRDKQTTPDKPALGQAVQSHLGEQLRQFYSSIATEPVPERFVSLLDEMERQERSRRANSGKEQET